MDKIKLLLLRKINYEDEGRGSGPGCLVHIVRVPGTILMILKTLKIKTFCLHTKFYYRLGLRI